MRAGCSMCNLIYHCGYTAIPVAKKSGDTMTKSFRNNPFAKRCATASTQIRRNAHLTRQTIKHVSSTKRTAEFARIHFKSRAKCNCWSRAYQAEIGESRFPLLLLPLLATAHLTFELRSGANEQESSIQKGDMLLVHVH